ncbi:MAG TPA: hypothetical protein VEC56_07050 [Candidatus Krumholzibacteria bacterium]|nr:hypothetical protein [Candidatus Krumholzibacteria bacterium]
MRRLACIAVAAITILVTAGDDRAKESFASMVVPQAPAASGMVVQIDPATGLPVTPTPETMLALQDRMKLNRSTEGLVEVPSAVVGGGYTVDLQGRFQHSMTVTIDASGVVHSTCTTSGTSPEEVTASCVDH